MKKNCTIVLLVLFLLISFKGIAENKPIGTWTVHPSFAAPAQKVIDTENMVYFLSGNKLFSYDKKNDENYSYTIGNKLSDSDITDIYYNYDKNYLFIAYKSGNIDLLYSDGDIANMSDIVDATTINPPLTINSVAFDGDKIYVATAFGLVIFNESRHEVIQSGIYNHSINAVTVMGDNIVVHYDGYFWFADKNGSLVKFDKFKKLYGYTVPKELIPVSDNKMLVRINDGSYYITMHTIDFETCKQVGWKGYRPTSSYIYSTLSYTSRGKDGIIYFVDNNKLCAIDGDYTAATFTYLCDLPEELKGCKIGTYNGANAIWSLDKDGIACHSISADGGVTVRMERFRPEEFSVNSVYYFYPTLDNKYLYIQNLGSTAYKFEGATIGTNIAQNTSRINLTTGEFEDMTLYPVDTRINQNSTADWYKYATTHTGLASDSNNPDTYFLPTRNEGMFKVNNGKYVGRYDENNSPVKLTDNRWILYGAAIDRGGNLWAMTDNRLQTQLPLIVLPAAKCKLNPEDVKTEDWFIPDVSSVDYWGGQDAMFLICKKSNMIFVVTHGNDYQLFAYDTRGTFNDFSDDRFYLWESFIDQDGNKLTPARKNCLVEDHDGKVWIGTNEGVIEISSPSNAINPSMTVNHVKVPRNDGTNTADYLLGTDNVMSISVDASNRKWIATYGSGLFLVSPDGHEILENYTSDNSPLTDNNVNAVYANPNSSTIYIGHRSGLITYSTDASPAEEDYSNVYAFPNPVRPDYTGPIYVRGLMDNSLVKIADVSGNVIFQGRAEGGLFAWDGCTAAGKRVKTGVYYVMVSQNASGSSSGAVTKIMVVN